MGFMSYDERPEEEWGLVAPVDLEVEREKHDYEVLEDKIIKCADCGKKLVEIIKVHEDPTAKRVKCTCPCGGESFIYEVTGKTYIQAVEGRTISDMPMDIIDGVMHITVEVI